MKSKTELANVKTYTMRELNQNTAHVLEEINDSGKPAVITKHGRFIALISPLRDAEIEQLVLSHGPLADELAERAEGDLGDTLSPAEMLSEIADRKTR